MSRKIRVGVVGFAHMHVNNVLALFAKHPRVELAAGADTAPARPELRDGVYTRGWNLRHALAKLGLPRAYDDYREMLRQEGLDLAIVTSENARHAEAVEACAAAGADVCVEKPMAATFADALRMVRAARAAGTRLIVNWPMTWNPAARKAKDLADAGAVGRVLQVRVRLGHTGPLGPGARHEGVVEEATPLSAEELGAVWWHSRAAGGGALIDYCCYGAMMARWIIGEPAVAAVGMRANLASPFGDADDNGAMIVRFARAMGLFEASWTTADHGTGGGPVIHGTGGTLVMEGDGGRPQVREIRSGGRVRVHRPRLPKGRHDIAHEYVHHVDTGEPLHPTLDAPVNLDAMAILDAGARSADSGRLELVAGEAWPTA